MRRLRAAYSAGILAVPLILAGTVPRSPAGPGTSVTFTGSLHGVAVTSAGNAWAVGGTTTISLGTLIEQWNSAAWK